MIDKIDNDNGMNMWGSCLLLHVSPRNLVQVSLHAVSRYAAMLRNVVVLSMNLHIKFPPETIPGIHYFLSQKTLVILQLINPVQESLTCNGATGKIPENISYHWLRKISRPITSTPSEPLPTSKLEMNAQTFSGIGKTGRLQRKKRAAKENINPILVTQSAFPATTHIYAKII